MADIVSPKTRSRMMSGIRGKNTTLEMMIRKELHHKGFRYRLHAKNLPGTPDLVFPKYKAVVQINGCFWHGHTCHLFKWPASRQDFWERKILGNRERDRVAQLELANLGWRTLTIWECSMKGKYKLPLDTVVNQICLWLKSTETMILEIEGETDTGLHK